MSTKDKDIAILQARIKDIDSRLTEIDESLAHLLTTGFASYETQELENEKSALWSDKAATQSRLHALTTPPAPPDLKKQQQREAFIAAELAESTAQTMNFITKLEASGEYRQAKIHRMSLLDRRREIEARFPE